MKPLFLVLTALLTYSASAQALDVVTSIKPLQLLTQDLIAADDRVTLLLPTTASPHDYQMRPSDMRKLQQADLFLWIGPQMERFLTRPLASAVAPHKRLALLDTPELSLRYGGHQHDDHEAQGHEAQGHEVQDPDEQGHHEPHHHEKSHSEQAVENAATQDPASLDPHIWLSPSNAAKMARHISAALQRLNPSQTEHYQQNLARFLVRLQQADAAIQANIEPLRGQGYVVFHDAFGYFEQHVGLAHLAAFTPSPERRPGAQQIDRIRQVLQSHRATCLFTEPQFKSPLIRTVTQDLTVTQVELDPMAGGIAVVDGYTALLADLGQRFGQCLQPPGH